MTNPLSVLDELLTAALAACGAEMGNVQLVDPPSASLKIVASRNCGWRFLQFFDSVETTTAACGTALREGRRVVVENVAESPIFAGSPALGIMLDARALSVQSTPLVSRAGEVIGMVSTHRSEAGSFALSQIAALDRLVDRAAGDIAAAAIKPGCFAWTAARSRVLLDSSYQLINGTQRRLGERRGRQAGRAVPADHRPVSDRKSP